MGSRGQLGPASLASGQSNDPSVEMFRRSLSTAWTMGSPDGRALYSVYIAPYRYRLVFKRIISGEKRVASIRVRDDGSAPVVEKMRESPFKQGDYLVFEVRDEVARYWNKLPPGRRDELFKQSRKQSKDIRLILEGFVFKPAHTK